MTGKTTPSSSTTTIPPEVLAQYQTVNAQAQKAAATPFQQYSTDPNAFVAPLNSTQNAGIAGAQNYANAAQPAAQAGEMLTAAGSQAVNPTALSGAAISQYENPYTSYVTQQMSDLMQQQNDAAQSKQLGTAIQSGAFGGDRAGVAAANLAGQQSLAYGNTMAPILQTGYNNAQATAVQQQAQQLAAQQANQTRLLSGGQQIASIGAGAQASGIAGAQAEMGAGTAAQTTQQAGLTALYNQFLQQQSYPFQTAQFAANVAEGTGALSGSTTNSTTAAPFFSDRRLKEDIKKIGTAKNGLPIYSFRYKDDPEKITRLGFMADEVEKKHPEAVGLAGGYKTVDYDEAVKRYAGGLVVDSGEREGYDVGGAPPTTWGGVANAQAGMYGGASPAALPYGGKSHVPASTPSQHQMLQPTKPAAAPPSTLSQLAQLGTQAKGIEDLGTTGQDAYNKVKGLVPTTPAAPPMELHTPPAGVVAPPPAGVSSVPPQSMDQIASQQGNPPVAQARGGGLARGGLADGGSPEGLYQSGQGLDIPEQGSNVKAPTPGAAPGAAGPSTVAQLAGLGAGAAGLSNLGSMASGAAGGIGSGLASVLPFLTFAAGGGIAGRHGYATDGLVDPAGGATLDDPNAPASVPSFANTPPVDATEPKKGLEPPSSAEGFAKKVIDQPVAAPPAAKPEVADPALIASADAALAAGRGTPKPVAFTPPPPQGGVAPPAAAAPVDLDAAAHAIKGIESSGGNYSAFGPVLKSGAYAGDRAYGAYQVMGKNVPEWTQRALGYTMTPQEFLADPKAQDAVFKDRFGAAAQKYGNVQDAASEWFTGGPLSAGAGKHDQLGTSGAGYVAQFMKGLQNAGSGLADAGQQAAQDVGSGLAGAGRNVVDAARSAGSGLAGAASNAGQTISDYAGNAGQAITQAGQKAGGWYDENKSWLGPLLQGIGTMASSNSRYLGAAALQGLGAGAGAYQKQAQSQAGIENVQAATAHQNIENVKALTIDRNGVLMSPVVDKDGNPNWGAYWDVVRGTLPAGWRAMNPGEASAWAAKGRPVSGSPPAAANTPPAGVVASPAAPPMELHTPPAGVVAPPAAANKPPVAAPSGQPTAMPISPHVGALGAANEGPGSADPSTLAAGKAHYDAAIAGAVPAANNMTQMRTLGKTVADLNTHPGLTGSGAGGPQLAGAAGLLQHLGQAAGFDTSWLNKMPDEDQIMQKFRIGVGAARAQGTGSDAYATIRDFANALPGMNLSPRANAEIMANLLTISQQSRDMSAHAQEYANKQPNPQLRTYGNIISDYQNKYKSTDYDHMTQQLAGLLENPKTAAMVRDMMTKYTNPRTQAALLEAAHVDPAIARVFQ